MTRLLAVCRITTPRRTGRLRRRSAPAPALWRPSVSTSRPGSPGSSKALDLRPETRPDRRMAVAYNSIEAQLERLRAEQKKWRERRRLRFHFIGWSAGLLCVGVFMSLLSPPGLPWLLIALFVIPVLVIVASFVPPASVTPTHLPEVRSKHYLLDPWTCGHCKTRHRPSCGCYEGCSSGAGLGDWWLPAISAQAGAPDEHPQECAHDAPQSTP